MGSLFSGPKVEGVDIDLEAIEPTDGEKKMYDEVDAVLSKREEIISELEDYKGCQHLAKAAMGTVGKGSKTSSDDSSAEKTCFDALIGAVNKIVLFNEYAEEIGAMFPRLLAFLSQDTEGKSMAGLDKQQALAIQLGQLLDFALKFDGLRMMKPQLSNDFSYYRRLLPKYSSTHPGITVKEDLASSMALFTAEPTPMTNKLIKTTLKTMENNPGVTVVLSTLANSCMLMLKQNRFTNPETTLFCVRAMTGAFVLFDHVDEVGAFAKKSHVDVKQVVNILKKDWSKETSLINSIRYSTKNFSTAPDNVQALFD